MAKGLYLQLSSHLSLLFAHRRLSIVVGRIMAPNDVHIPTAEPVSTLLTWQKGTLDMWLGILRWEGGPALPKWT